VNTTSGHESLDEHGDSGVGPAPHPELHRSRRAIVSGILGTDVAQRGVGLVGCDAWLEPLCHLLTSPAAVISLLDADGTVITARSTTRHRDLDRALVGTRARSIAEWAPLLQGIRAWTEVDHTRSGRAFRATLGETGSTSIIHVAAPSTEGGPAAILSVFAPLVAARPPGLLRDAVRSAGLLGWVLGDPPVARAPLSRVADLRQDPREIVAALADALETLAPPVVHVAGLGRPAIANAAAIGLFDGSATTPRSILEHPLVGHDLVAHALFGDGRAARRRAPGGFTRLQILRSGASAHDSAPVAMRPSPIESILLVFPRQMMAAPGPAIHRRASVGIPDTWDLSRRERDVVALLLEGDRVASIATKLYVSPETVRGHLKRVYRKVGVRSQIELIVLARGPSDTAG
jgi:DNA-binding CsgD family transcriptional regulator